MNMNTISTNMMSTFDGAYSVFPGVLQPNWVEAAKQKGFDLIARLVDRFHLALRCRHCGGIHKSKVFTLMSARPMCPRCLEQEWHSDAEAAGLEFLRRDTAHRHYAIYTAACGHQVRRQTGQIKRVAAGEVALRCETCHAATEAAEASARGWNLLRPDPDGNPNYRFYRHEHCGQEQRIARANMQTGRFECARCGAGWAAEKSYLYAMSFVLPNGRELVKLGFSRDPDSRLLHQLRRNPEMPCEILTMVPMATGNDAIRVEKRLHGRLRREHPAAMVDPQSYRGHIRVRSEIYDGSLTPVILQMLVELSRGRSNAA